VERHVIREKGGEPASARAKSAAGKKAVSAVSVFKGTTMGGIRGNTPMIRNKRDENRREGGGIQRRGDKGLLGRAA